MYRKMVLVIIPPPQDGAFIFVATQANLNRCPICLRDSFKAQILGIRYIELCHMKQPHDRIPQGQEYNVVAERKNSTTFIVMIGKCESP